MALKLWRKIYCIVNQEVVFASFTMHEFLISIHTFHLPLIQTGTTSNFVAKEMWGIFSLSDFSRMQMGASYVTVKKSSGKHFILTVLRDLNLSDFFAAASLACESRFEVPKRRFVSGRENFGNGFSLGEVLWRMSPPPRAPTHGPRSLDGKESFGTGFASLDRKPGL